MKNFSALPSSQPIDKSGFSARDGRKRKGIWALHERLTASGARPVRALEIQATFADMTLAAASSLRLAVF
jgi:hypothetical protein